MRTNIDIDDAVLDAAMKAGPFKTKKDAVEAGLKLVARQAVYRDLLALQGQLHWDGDALDGKSRLGVNPDGAVSMISASSASLATSAMAATSASDPSVQAARPTPRRPLAKP